MFRGLGAVQSGAGKDVLPGRAGRLRGGGAGLGVRGLHVFTVYCYLNVHNLYYTPNGVKTATWALHYCTWVHR